jgi:adenosylcobyric acid synthase
VVDDPAGVEGPPGSAAGLGRLRLRTAFAPGKVLDRPAGVAVDGPGTGAAVAGYRIHHGRVSGEATPWLVDDGGVPIGWHAGATCATTLHGVLESDALRAGVLRWAAAHAGLPEPPPSPVAFAAARAARFDRIADALETHLDVERVLAIIAEGAPSM